MAAKTFKKTPANLALQRSFVLTDALMYSVVLSKDAQNQDVVHHEPVLVVEHGIRGTQNVSEQKKDEYVNIQRTESAKLSTEGKELLVQFDLRTSNLDLGVTMCAEKSKEINSTEFRQSINDFIARARSGSALQELCLRYARNVLNGRWLWRNRSYAIKLRIEVHQYDATGALTLLTESTDALRVSLQDFKNPSPAEHALANALADGLSGTPVCLQVRAYVDFGIKGAVEVYPSQNYVKREKGFARSLYKLPLRGTANRDALGSGFTIVGHAALRDQKIGNALRSIDTWYEAFKTERIVAAVEPVGANMEAAGFLREKKENAFELMKTLNLIDPMSDNGQYMLAILIRGGVFGESSKKDKDAKKDQEDASDDSTGE